MVESRNQQPKQPNMFNLLRTTPYNTEVTKTLWPWPAADNGTVQISQKQAAAIRDLVEHVRGDCKLSDIEIARTLEIVAEAVGLDSGA